MQLETDAHEVKRLYWGRAAPLRLLVDSLAQGERAGPRGRNFGRVYPSAPARVRLLVFGL
jgi:hypothetical protein